MLRIERRTAIRLLHRFGGFQCGKTFLMDRLQLIAQLEAIDSSDEIAVERGRRARLADELDKTRRLTAGRKVHVDVTASVRDRVMKDLPTGIHLSRGELRVEFCGAEDLLTQLFELSQAMVNDFATFQAAVDDAAVLSG